MPRCTPWQATVKRRAHGTGCPRCYREQNQRSLREANARRRDAAVARRPLASTHPQLAAELHRTHNPGLDSSSVSAGSGLRVWWRCATCGHEWQATITNRTNRVRPSGCPACAGKATPPERSLAARHPDLYAEWHDTRNGKLDPFALSPGSGRPAWWRCRACGHEWQARIESRANARHHRLYVHGKGGREREAPVPEAVQHALESWAAIHPLARGVGLLDGQPLFVRLGRHGDQEPLRLSAVAVHRLLRRHCLAAGVPERLAHPRTLRAYWATHLLEAGVPVHEASARLRHVDLRTTARYAAPRRERVDEIAAVLERRHHAARQAGCGA